METMTNEEINIAIAEACGFEADFSNDLNAMHKAEKVLLSMDGSCGYWETYSNALTAKLGCVDIFHATARQRAEAFLKTLNLYTQ